MMTENSLHHNRRGHQSPTKTQETAKNSPVPKEPKQGEKTLTPDVPYTILNKL